jgi:predicted amidohydrolase
MAIRVAAVQIGATGEKEDNIKKASQMLDSKIFQNVKHQFICFPEMFSYYPNPGDDFSRIDRIAEGLDGPTYQMFSAYAKKLEAYIVTGSFLLRKGGKHYNTTLILSPTGDLIGEYSKTHLFDAPSFRESEFFVPGDSCLVVDTDFAKIGVAICYDIRFPEFLRTLALKGAQILFCPAAFPIAEPSPGEDHWQVLTRAAALHNMVYVVAVNQIGIRAPFTFFGRSVVVDPWGIEISKASNTECIISAEVDLDYLREMRAQRMVLEHRRPELYEL